MDLGIVVVSYNTRQLTRDCLQSVYAALAASPLRAHVWAVDNASPDGSAAMLRESFPQVSLIASAENLGFARGANLGLRALLEADQRPPFVLLLNPDTLVLPGALDKMVAFMTAQPGVGVVGAQLRYGDGSFQHGAFRFPTLPMILFDFWSVNHRLLDSRLNGRYPRHWYAVGRPFAIDHPLGAALMIRTPILEQVGLLDEAFFMYCEEIDWCMRIKAAGWEIYCVPDALITHLGGQSTQQFRERMFVVLWRSRFRLFAKHYSACYQRVARLIVHAGLAQEARRIQAATRRGQMTPEEAQRRLEAYREIREL